MKRYKYTFWNGMIEVPDGEYVKEKETEIYLQHWIASAKRLEQEVSRFSCLLAEEETLSILLKWLLSLSIICNIAQLIYYLN